MDNIPIVKKLEMMEQYKKDRIVKLWGWRMTLEQIHKRTGHSPKLIKMYLQDVGVWEDRRAKKKPASIKTKAPKHSGVYAT